MDKILQSLKENEKPFGLMSKEMQDKVREIGLVDNFRLYANQDFGGIINSPDYVRDDAITYRLRPDYKEEPEVVKCEVKISTKENLFYFDPMDRHGPHPRLSHAPDDPDFIGFLYEDGCISALPRMYDIPLLGNRNFFVTESIANYTVLTPTHVLFKSKK